MIQCPSTKANWLYQDHPDGTRLFATRVFLGKEANPWNECTNDEKEQWEREHAPAVPEPLNDK